MPWIDAITDRTQADVDYAKEHPYSSESLKGMRGASDLNRIANNCKVIRDSLIANGMTVTALRQKSGWVKNERDWTKWPNADDLQRVLDDIKMLRGVYVVMASTPGVPSIPINSYQKMNDIEKNLDDMHFLINGMMAVFFHSDEVYSGEV